MIVIDKEKCKGCLLCVAVCPKGLLKKSAKLNKKGVETVEFIKPEECTGCAMCAVICPDCCIEVFK